MGESAQGCQGDFMRENPSVAKEVLRQMVSNTAAKVNPKDYYPDSFGGNPAAFAHLSKEFMFYIGKRVWWVGRKGRMLKLDPRKTTPIMERDFDAKKLKAVDFGIQRAKEPVIFYAPGVAPYTISENFTVPASPRGATYIDLVATDVGETFLEVRDGCHRLFGALLSGEPYGWGIISPTIYNSYQDWLCAGRPQNIHMAQEFNYLEGNLM